VTYRGRRDYSAYQKDEGQDVYLHSIKEQFVVEQGGGDILRLPSLKVFSENKIDSAGKKKAVVNISHGRGKRFERTAVFGFRRRAKTVRK